MSPKKEAPREKVVSTNRRARYDYEIIETFEAGLELAGSEVKSLRIGKADIVNAYATIDKGQLWLCQLHIGEYQASPYSLPPDRRRRLLVHRIELDRVAGKVARKGMTLVPLRLYFSPRGWAKVEIAVAKGRTAGDRREAVKKRESEREARSY
jgi:SsrA-binding protein